jgi:hypothetical protein
MIPFLRLPMIPFLQAGRPLLAKSIAAFCVAL